jgi:hypothetical protein
MAGVGVSLVVRAEAQVECGLAASSSAEDWEAVAEVTWAVAAMVTLARTGQLLVERGADREVAAGRASAMEKRKQGRAVAVNRAAP